MGAMLISQSLAAAYKNISQDFQVHQLAVQFFNAGRGKPPILFSVVKISDGRNNLSRIVHVSQGSMSIATLTMSFIRKPRPDGLDLSYSPAMPVVERPDDAVDHLGSESRGIIDAQSLGRAMS
jgi:acyl-CoA thioesterase II